MSEKEVGRHVGDRGRGVQPQAPSRGYDYGVEDAQRQYDHRNKDGVSLLEKWPGAVCSLDGIQLLSTVGYMRLGARGHKLATWGEKCVMGGMAHNHLSRTTE